jgi:hypothetical protein
MKSFTSFEIISIFALRETLWEYYNIPLLMMDLGFPNLGFLLSVLPLIGCFIVFQMLNFLARVGHSVNVPISHSW